MSADEVVAGVLPSVPSELNEPGYSASFRRYGWNRAFRRRRGYDGHAGPVF